MAFRQANQPDTPCAAQRPFVLPSSRPIKQPAIERHRAVQRRSARLLATAHRCSLGGSFMKQFVGRGGPDGRLISRSVSRRVASRPQRDVSTI
eukprot:6212811-Pleurochrysis_carterae.AAC.4